MLYIHVHLQFISFLEKNGVVFLLYKLLIDEL